MSCGVGCRCASDPVFQWLWCQSAAAAPIWPLAWEPPCAVCAALKNAKITFFLKAEQYSSLCVWVCVYISHFLYSLICWWTLRLLPYLTNFNTTALTIKVHVHFQIIALFFRRILSSGIAGSHVSSIFGLRNCHTVFAMSERIYLHINSAQVFPFPYILTSMCCLCNFWW